jgi:hypothetical protein
VIQHWKTPPMLLLPLLLLLPPSLLLLLMLLCCYVPGSLSHRVGASLCGTHLRRNRSSLQRQPRP